MEPTYLDFCERFEKVEAELAGPSAEFDNVEQLGRVQLGRHISQAHISVRLRRQAAKRDINVNALGSQCWRVWRHESTRAGRYCTASQ